MSAMRGILAKAGDQFVATGGGGAEFRYDDGAAVIGDLGRFERGGAAAKREREQSDGGVARTGDIENLARLRGNVMGRLVMLEKNHALFAESDENVFRLPFLEQSLADSKKLGVPGWIVLGVAPWNSGSEEGFGSVRFYDGHAAPGDGMVGVGIRSDDFAGGVGVPRNLRDEVGSQKSFAVIFENNGVDLGQHGAHGGGDRFNLLRGKADDAFPVDPDDLLLPGDDARFDDGLEPGVLDCDGGVDLFAGQQFAQMFALGVLAEEADDRDALDEFPEIAGDVGGPARIGGFAGDFDHRDRGFRRDAAYLAPNELVEHEIADNEETLAGRPFEDCIKSRRRHKMAGSVGAEGVKMFGVADLCRSKFCLESPINPEYLVEINSRSCR